MNASPRRTTKVPTIAQRDRHEDAGRERAEHELVLQERIDERSQETLASEDAGHRAGAARPGRVPGRAYFRLSAIRLAMSFMNVKYEPSAGRACVVSSTTFTPVSLPTASATAGPSRAR